MLPQIAKNRDPASFVKWKKQNINHDDREAARIGVVRPQERVQLASKDHQRGHRRRDRRYLRVPPRSGQNQASKSASECISYNVLIFSSLALSMH